jgi:drug/metabolite transporter, DME family
MTAPSPTVRDASPSGLSPARGRLYIFLAALLWSTSGAFTKVLTQDTALGLNDPALDAYPVGDVNVPVQIACYRVLFAGLVLLPLVRRSDMTVNGLMIVMGIFFAVMNTLFVTAMALGTAANAIVLQYTAPMWMFLASVLLLREPVHRRDSVTLGIALAGIAVIVIGGGAEGAFVIGIALVSGFSYACVVICLRVLRHESTQWLTAWNFLFSGLVLVPFMVALRPPTFAQFIVLFLYGAAQMALPYWLMARALRAVSPAEAGTITLFEPILNPLWTYLMSGEEPARETYIGGALILAALVWRYWPRRVEPKIRFTP